MTITTSDLHLPLHSNTVISPRTRRTLSISSRSLRRLRMDIENLNSSHRRVRLTLNNKADRSHNMALPTLNRPTILPSSSRVSTLPNRATLNRGNSPTQTRKLAEKPLPSTIRAPLQGLVALINVGSSTARCRPLAFSSLHPVRTVWRGVGFLRARTPSILPLTSSNAPLLVITLTPGSSPWASSLSPTGYKTVSHWYPLLTLPVNPTRSCPMISPRVTGTSEHIPRASRSG